ncbi:pentapeptide repeat-containing protein [Shewanella gaetbuli]
MAWLNQFKLNKIPAYMAGIFLRDTSLRNTFLRDTSLRNTFLRNTFLRNIFLRNTRVFCVIKTRYKKSNIIADIGF